MSGRSATTALGVRSLQLLLLILVLPPALLLGWYLYTASGAPWFWDWQTVPCGIESMLATGDPNRYMTQGFGGGCDGYGFAYTLPPWITLILSGVAGALGYAGLNLLYGLLYGAALWQLFRFAGRFAGDWKAVLLFALLVANGVFVVEFGSGNVAVLLSCALCIAIAYAKRWAWLLVAAPVLAALFKPHLAVYLMVPLAAGVPFVWVCAALFAIALIYSSDILLHPQAFAQWWGFVMPDTYADRNSFGSLRLLQELGVEFGQWGPQLAGAALWALLVALLGWWLLRRAGSLQDRAMIGLLCALLMLPRLKEYDCFALVALVFWARGYLGPHWGRRYQWSVVAAGLLLPALWWWLRSAWLLPQAEALSLKLLVDLHWHYRMQGAFLLLLLLLTLGFLLLQRAGPAPSENPQ